MSDDFSQYTVHISPSKDMWKCPITLSTFRNPMRSPAEFVYEYEAIRNWIKHSRTDPITKQRISVDQLKSAPNISAMISNFERELTRKKYFYFPNHYVIQDPKLISESPTMRFFHAEWKEKRNKPPGITVVEIKYGRILKDGEFFVKLTRNDYIVRIFGLFGEHDQKKLKKFVQEDSKFVYLSDLLSKRSEAFEQQVLMVMFNQIVDAMIYLVSNNVVHGHLCTESVLVFRLNEQDPQATLVKITDIGLHPHSEMYDVKGDEFNLQSNRKTKKYCAPEILKNSARVTDWTEKSDVYSFGVLMMEMFTNHTKSLENTKTIGRGNEATDTQKLHRLPLDDDPLSLIIKQCLSECPNERPRFTEIKSMLTNSDINKAVTNQSYNGSEKSS